MDTSEIKYCSVSITKLLKLKYKVPRLSLDVDGELLLDGKRVQLGGYLNENTRIEYSADYSAFYREDRGLIDKTYAGVLSY